MTLNADSYDMRRHRVVSYILALLISTAAISACGGGSSLGGKTSEIAVTAVAGLRWDSGAYRTERGQVTFVVENQDTMVHNFVLLGAGGNKIPGTSLRVEAGQTQRITVTLEANTYEVFCDIPGHQTMKSRLIVE